MLPLNLFAFVFPLCGTSKTWGFKRFLRNASITLWLTITTKISKVTPIRRLSNLEANFEKKSPDIKPRGNHHFYKIRIFASQFGKISYKKIQCVHSFGWKEDNMHRYMYVVYVIHNWIIKRNEHCIITKH